MCDELKHRAENRKAQSIDSNVDEYRIHTTLIHKSWDEHKTNEEKR